MNISRLDHLVLTVKNINSSLDFYQNVLGMQQEIFGGNRVALKFGKQKINLHEYGNEFEPKATLPTPGSADLCFITDDPINAVITHLKKHDIEIIEGPVERTGAQYKLLSIYIRDPDKNLIEISNSLE